MLAIYKRELKAYLSSFIGFLFMAVTLFFLGLYFSIYNLLNGYPYFAYTISSVAFIFMVSVPVLTMRIMAEERRNKTDQLILTAPVSVGGVVMGKFLALLTIFAIPTAIICTYPVIMSFFGTVPMGEAYLSILAFFLFGMTAIAIGLFVSALTESQVIAAVLSFIVLFLGYMMSSICNVVSTTGNFLTKLLGCFDLYTPFSNLLNGTLDVKGVVYYITVTAFVLFLTTQSIQKRRYSVSVKNFSLSAYSTGMIAVMLAIVVAANIVVAELPGTYTSIDMTSQKFYSLTEQSKEYVKSIEEDVTIYVLAGESSQDTTLQQTLARYEDLSKHITVENVDPIVNPTFYKQYTEDGVTSNSVIVVSDKRSKVIDYSEIYETSYGYDQYYGYTNTTTGYDGEGQITSALNYVLSDDMPKLYFTTGHGELTLESTFTSALEKENVEYDSLNLMDVEAVPEDAAAVVIHGASSDFSADDAEKLLAYLEAGGKVIVVVGYTEESLPNLESVLDYMGIQVAEGLVVEQSQSNYYRSPYYILPDVESNTYTTGVYGSYYLFLPYSQGLITDSERTDVVYDAFLNTSDQAFSKVGDNAGTDYSKTEADIEGPFALAVEVVKTLEDGQATMVVYGCNQIFTEAANEMVSGANAMLFSNTVGAFADHEVSVSIPVKSYDVAYLTVTQSHLIALMVATTIVLPAGLLVAGFVIWFKRRRR